MNDKIEFVSRTDTTTYIFLYKGVEFSVWLFAYSKNTKRGFGSINGFIRCKSMTISTNEVIVPQQPDGTTLDSPHLIEFIANHVKTGVDRHFERCSAFIKMLSSGSDASTGKTNG